MKKLALLLSLLALASAGLVACGGDDADEGTTSPTTALEDEGPDPIAVSIAADADGALAYEQSEATAPAGDVTIEFDNPAPLGHDVVVEDADGDELARTDIISEDSTTATGTFEAGEYTFYCSVSNHRDAGMEGTLTVE